MINVGMDMLKADNEELGPGLKVTQLQYQMDARRDGTSGVDRWSLLGTQLEVDLSFNFREVRHAKKAVNLLGGKDAKAPGGFYIGAWQDGRTPMAGTAKSWVRKNEMGMKPGMLLRYQKSGRLARQFTCNL